MNAIEVKDITKKYDNFRLNHVSLQIPEGSIYGLIGEMVQVKQHLSTVS